MAEGILSHLTIESVIVPVDLAGGANNGDWISLEGYERVAFVLFKGAGTAGDDPVLSFEQATDNSGTGAKALNVSTVHQRIGTLASTPAYSRVTQTAGQTYTDATSAESQAIIVAEFSARELDADGGFDHCRVNIADVGVGAQVGCVFALLLGPRYKSALPESAL